MLGTTPDLELKPDFYVFSVLEIDFDSLNRPYVMFDLDNTLLTRDSSVIAPEIIKHISMARKSGAIKSIAIITNICFPLPFLTNRARAAAKQIEADVLVLACLPFLKPHKVPFLRALDEMEAIPEESVMVGDQIWTDIKGGNGVGAKTILVSPLGSDLIFTRPRRLKQTQFLQRLKMKPTTMQGSTR